MFYVRKYDFRYLGLSPHDYRKLKFLTRVSIYALSTLKWRSLSRTTKAHQEKRFPRSSLNILTFLWLSGCPQSYFTCSTQKDKLGCIGGLVPSYPSLLQKIFRMEVSSCTLCGWLWDGQKEASNPRFLAVLGRRTLAANEDTNWRPNPHVISFTEDRHTHGVHAP